MIAIDHVLFVAKKKMAFKNQREDKMVPPPEQRAEGEFLISLEVFGKVEVLVGILFKMLALHKLTFGWVEARRRQEVDIPQLSLEHSVQLFQQAADLFHDARLREEEVPVGDQPQLLGSERRRRIQHDRSRRRWSRCSSSRITVHSRFQSSSAMSMNSTPKAGIRHHRTAAFAIRSRS